jgi:phage tail-like protein
MGKSANKKTTVANPYKGFKFHIRTDGKIVLGANKVSALERTTEVVHYRSGGDNLAHKLPGRSKYEVITVERAVTHDRDFADWISSIDAANPAVHPKKELTLETMSEKGHVLFAFVLHAAWVSKITVRPESNVKSNALAIESMHIEIERWSRAAVE